MVKTFSEKTRQQKIPSLYDLGFSLTHNTTKINRLIAIDLLILQGVRPA
jgi:hypothetical protein